MDDILDNIQDYNKKRKRKVLIVFDDMISHVMSHKKSQQVLFKRCKIKLLSRFPETAQKNLLIF